MVAAYDKQRPLVIDPVLVYSTYLGGSSYDNISGVAVDQQGNVYVTGTTESADFPGYPEGGYGFYPFVAKLNAAGTALVYSTVFGTSSAEGTHGIAVDGAGNAYVAGSAVSSGLPLIPDPPICTYQGGQDGFIIKFNQAGNAMLYSTYLGGTDEDVPSSIAVDGAGQAYVTGQTKSIDFKTTSGALHEDFQGGGYDGFVSKINAEGTALVYSTYLGGSGNDYPAGITADGCRQRLRHRANLFFHRFYHPDAHAPLGRRSYGRLCRQAQLDWHGHAQLYLSGREFCRWGQ